MTRGLALASLRHRTTAFTATFVSVLLGAWLMGTFATLAETSLSGRLSAEDAETLRIMGGVVGAYATVIVVFSVASALSIIVSQRAGELALLRIIGAGPGQVRRLVRTEARWVVVPAAAVGALAAHPTGRAVLALLRRGGIVDGSVAFHSGVAAPALAFGVVTAAGTMAAALAARRATREPATLTAAGADPGDGSARLHRWRLVLGAGLVAYGIVMGVVTITVTSHNPDPYMAMSTSGSASILTGVGLATLAPLLLRAAARPVGVVARRAGAAGWLAAEASRRRAHLLGSVLAPVIVFTAASVGTLMSVGIDNRTIGAGHPESRTINLLNNLITGMLCLFAAIMVINAFAAVVAGRRQELARLRLLGATRAQVEHSVMAEGMVVAAVGVAAGTVASLATVVPFSMARHEGLVPDGQLWLPPLLVAAAVALTVAAARRAARRGNGAEAVLR